MRDHDTEVLKIAEAAEAKGREAGRMDAVTVGSPAARSKKRAVETTAAVDRGRKRRA